MYHSVQFIDDDLPIYIDGGLRLNGYNTWDDWDMIPSVRPIIVPPEPEILLVDVPGRHGALDLTQALTGDIRYKDRVGSFEFYVMNEGHRTWDQLYSSLLLVLHGRRCKIVLVDDQPGYYYTGRVRLENWTNGKDWSRVTIGYICEPYKRDIWHTDWESL